MLIRRMFLGSCLSPRLYGGRFRLRFNCRCTAYAQNPALEVTQFTRQQGGVSTSNFGRGSGLPSNRGMSNFGRQPGPGCAPVKFWPHARLPDMQHEAGSSPVRPSNSGPMQDSLTCNMRRGPALGGPGFYRFYVTHVPGPCMRHYNVPNDCTLSPSAGGV